MREYKFLKLIQSRIIRIEIISCQSFFREFLYYCVPTINFHPSLYIPFFQKYK